MDNIQEGRIYLRPLTESDITSRYLSWHDNLEHLKYYSSTEKKFTRELLIQEMNKGKKLNSLFIYGIIMKENDTLIGNVKIGPIANNHKTSDLVVFIGDTHYLGKGLAIEAIKAGNKAAFKYHGIRKLFGGMFRGNIGSVKAYTQADWVIEGVLEGQFLYKGKPEDRVLVACFNPKFFSDLNHKKKFLSIEDLYQK